MARGQNIVQLVILIAGKLTFYGFVVALKIRFLIGTLYCTVNWFCKIGQQTERLLSASANA